MSNRRHRLRRTVAITGIARSPRNSGSWGIGLPEVVPRAARIDSGASKMFREPEAGSKELPDGRGQLQGLFCSEFFVMSEGEGEVPLWCPMNACEPEISDDRCTQEIDEYAGGVGTSLEGHGVGWFVEAEYKVWDVALVSLSLGVPRRGLGIISDWHYLRLRCLHRNVVGGNFGGIEACVVAGAMVGVIVLGMGTIWPLSAGAEAAGAWSQMSVNVASAESSRDSRRSWGGGLVNGVATVIWSWWLLRENIHVQYLNLHVQLKI
ncbi:hypothetical protein DFH08DRAFT_995603 [Mycena albidolilacea]|uniref:Uncharacterized protein n=1 Tax=Mycena albidolilacea TaxID=1033008 RepID=A0AAD7A6X6_9AGAR|nr:hypothetical protein DFH08DRAFT_995603 [Mycena albidolilacea]